MAGLTLTPGSGPSALLNLEDVLVHAPAKELAKLRFSFTLKDGSEVRDVIVRAPMKTRERRGDAMVDSIGKMRVERAGTPGESIWLEYADIAGWSFEQPAEE